jgi:hypothetical protein
MNRRFPRKYRMIFYVPKRNKILKAGTCGKCQNRKICEAYKGFLEERQRFKDKQFRYVKLAEDKDFGADEMRHPGLPTMINIEELQLHVQQNFEARLKETAVPITQLELNPLTKQYELKKEKDAER